MYVAPTQYEFPDVVVAADWNCTITDGEYSAGQSDKAVFGNLGQPMIPYGDLTQDQVLQWVWNSGVNKESIENTLIQQIKTQKNPPIITPPLPWDE